MRRGQNVEVKSGHCEKRQNKLATKSKQLQIATHFQQLLQLRKTFTKMPFMRTAVQRLGASSVRRFGAVAGQGGNSLKEFFSGMGLAGAVIGSVGVMLSAFHSVKGTRHLK